MTTLNKINISKNAESIIEDYHTPEFVSEVVTVRNNVLNLTEVPSEDYSVEIEDFTEVTDFDLLASNTVDDLFYVNYKQGYITLNKEHSFEKITVNYYGIGKSYLSAFRVYVGTDSTGNVAETIGDLFKSGENIIEALDIYGGYATMILRIDSTTEECNALLNKIDQRIAQIKSTDCQSTMITLTDWKSSSDGIYDYESSISHTLLSTNILCEFENSAGVSINDGSVKYKVVSNDKIKVYSDSRLPVKVKYMARYYNGLDSTNVTTIRQELEDSRMDSVNDEIYNNLGIRLNTESAKIKTITETLNELSTEYDNLQSIIRGTVLFAPDYGIVPNNTSSITPMMQTMANLSKTLGGVTIIIPKGDYYIDKRFELFSNTTLIMCEGCRIFKKDFGDGTHGDFFKAGISQSGNGSLVHDIRIYGGMLVGSIEVESAGGDGAMSFGFHRCSDILISGVHFKHANFYGHCIDMPGDKNVLIENCIFEGFKYRENQNRAFTEAIQIDNSYYGCFGSESMDYTGEGCQNITIRKCQFIPEYDDNGDMLYPAPYPLGTHAFVKDVRHKNITFENNYVCDCMERKEDHYGAWIRFYAVEDLNILNNKFEMKTIVYNCPIISIQCKVGGKVIEEEGTDTSVTTSRDINIDGNYFVGFKYPTYERRTSLILCYGMEQDASASRVYNRNLNITNNIFRDCCPDTITNNNYDVGVDVIRIDWFEDVKISGNMANGIGRFFYSDDKSSISEVDGETPYNIRGLIISNNSIRTCYREPLYVCSVQNGIIENNTMRDCGTTNIVTLKQNYIFSYSNNVINSNVKFTMTLTDAVLVKCYDTTMFNIVNNILRIQASNLTGDCSVFRVASNCSSGIVTGNMSNITAYPTITVSDTCTNITTANNI